MVTGVESGAEKKDGGDSADDLGKVCGLFGMKRTAQQLMFAIAEPLFQNLVGTSTAAGQRIRLEKEPGLLVHRFTLIDRILLLSDDGTML